jgi:hypothetical protein
LGHWETPQDLISTTPASGPNAPVLAGIERLLTLGLRWAVARVRPDAVINELTSLPRHYTPAEMKAAAQRDSRVRREGNVNLLAGMRQTFLA